MLHGVASIIENKNVQLRGIYINLQSHSGRRGGRVVDYGSLENC